MSVITLRMHKRYAVRSSVRLRRPNGREICGLLIELSGHGCRISNLCADAKGEALEAGERVEIWSDDGIALCGMVRWTRDRLAGVWLEEVLDSRRLRQIITMVRGVEDQDERRFGT